MYKPEHIEEAELTIYLKSGANFNISLTAIELVVALKSIGFEIAGKSQYNTFADNTLKDILEGKINPFRLKSVD